jgi:transketolase
MAFGVREHAMGAAVNGMAAHGGVVPFGASFLVFSDYVNPSIRLAALSKLRAIYVFTHDSIAVGEDGPTHEPIEQIAGLRAMPGLTVIRPADGNETAEAWAFAVQHQGPTLFALSRQNLPHLDRAGAKQPGVAKGAYVLSDSAGTPDVILIGTGSEVSLCVEAAAALSAKGIGVRVVSMPCMSLFEAQDAGYQEAVLPKAVRKRVVVEAAASFGWHRFSADGVIVAIDHFGASAPGEEVMKEFGFTAENVTEHALKLLGK